jgi:uncharacterized protein (TIGR03437 family)
MMFRKSNCLAMLAAVFTFLGASARAQSVSISQVEVNQAVGAQANNTRNFVAGKDTIVTALLASPVTIDTTQTTLTIQRDGRIVATLAPKMEGAAISAVEFPCPTRSTCGDWVAGSYVFTATVNGVTLMTPPTQFQARRALRILAVPIRANYTNATAGANITTVPDDRWKTAVGYLRRVYPVGADQIDWVIREQFDASNVKYNQETEEGQRALWDALNLLQPAGCDSTPKPANCVDFIVGFVSDRAGGYPSGSTQGFTYGMPTSIVVARDEDMEATTAHEIAHLYGVGDTYAGGAFRCNVNPSPDGVFGTDFDNMQNKKYSCTAGRTTYPSGQATNIPATTRAYEVGGRGLLGAIGDYMGSGLPQNMNWTTPEVYNAIFNGLAPLTLPATPQLQSFVSAVTPAAATPQRLLQFSGFIDTSNQISAEPWYSFTSSQPDTDTTSDLMIQAVGSEGTILASQAIEPNFYLLENPPRVTTIAPFHGNVRFPSATTKFQIVLLGKLLYSVNVSASDPKVFNVSPTAAGSSQSGKQTITWGGSRADGGMLNYRVEYSPTPSNPESFIILATNLTATSWTEDFSAVPGSKAAQIRITATDGIRAASAMSQSFMVPAKMPEVLIRPLTSTLFQKGALVQLAGEVDDIQDGSFPEASLLWTSSLDGKLGTGNTLELSRLSLGNHAITFTATNSSGMSASATVNLSIVASMAAPKMTALFNTASGAGGPIAPGELITIQGTNLGPATPSVFSINKLTGQVDKTLGGTRVLFDGNPAPITYASATQINLIVPFEVNGLSSVPMRIETGGVGYSYNQINVARNALGTFTNDSTGKGQAVAVNQDGTLNSAANPAAKGSFVTLYMTGLGSTEAYEVTGSVSGPDTTDVSSNFIVSATIAGQPAVTTYAGAAPGLIAGVNQVNIQLASNAATGIAQSVVVSVGTIASPATATIAVR